MSEFEREIRKQCEIDNYIEGPVFGWRVSDYDGYNDYYPCNFSRGVSL